MTSRSAALLHPRILIPLALLCGIVTLWGACPKPDLYGDTPFSAAVYDREERLLNLSLAADDRYRLFVPLADMSPRMVEATLLYEDRQFRRHPGINPAALVRAAWSTYVARERVIGGSTITMQLARLRYNYDTRQIGSKLKQMLRALQFERHYSKDEILEAYLNLAPYGGNIEGAGTAALIYFDRKAADLSLPEALALSVIPQNPVGRNPVSDGSALMAGRARLFAAWDAQRTVSKEARELMTLPLQARSSAGLPRRAPHFSRDFAAPRSAANGAVKTSLDLGYQSLIEHQIESFVLRRRVFGVENASALLVDHRSMEVLASVGSAAFFSEDIAGQVNGVRAKRSPGSTLKPFVYGLAIDRGLIHPMTLMKDAPKRYGAYTPENFDRAFIGPVFARDALIYSRNVPAIELLSRVGEDRFHRLLCDAGVSGLREPEFYGLAAVLGGNELTMEELVALYAALANGGRWQSLRNIQNGPPNAPARQILSPEASFLVLDMLRSNPRPDALAIEQPGSSGVAWKTGTSFAFRDAWTIGVFGPYVLAVWVGNFDGRGNPAFVGRTAAAPLFFGIVDALGGDFGEPPSPSVDLNLRKVAVCASTGDLPGRYCPQSVPSWFIPGVSPIKVSAVHRSVFVDSETGLRSCDKSRRNTRTEVYEFWPSDLTALFQRAGVSIKRPPPYEPGCALEIQAASGSAPQIRSPASGTEYYLRPTLLEDERLTLAATTDADARRVFWFANDRFLGTSDREKPLFWQPRVGQFELRVVDDLGRAATRPLTIRLAQ